MNQLQKNFRVEICIGKSLLEEDIHDIQNLN